MTKVLPCYSLCPLVEQNSFMGIASDAEADTVVVTTNSNIIGRYRISEPKEIGSWNSKGSISCRAIYDTCNRQYVAIFNNNEIRKWCGSDKCVDKVKKYKFAEKLRGLSTAPDGRTLVVFEKGQVRYLEEAIEVRKEVAHASCIADGERISTFDVVFVSNRLLAVLLVQRMDEFRIVGAPVDGSAPLFDLPVQRSNRVLRSHCVVVDKGCYFVSLWSDGKLYRDRVYPSAASVPANVVATVTDLKARQPVVMEPLSPYDVAICGCHKDGLLLLVFSLKYNSVQCKRFYENCANRPQLWSVNSKLFAIMGHNLVVIPYAQENRKLSTLIGSNQQMEDDAGTLPEWRIGGDSLPALLQRDEEDGVRELLKAGYDFPDSVLLSVVGWSLEMDTRRDILDTVLNEYCSNVNDVSQLRAICSVDQSLFVLEHIMSRLSGNENNFRLLKWASLFVDAFYQQYVMSEDTSILDRLNEYSSTLTKERDYVNEFTQLASVLSCVQRKKVVLTT